MLKKNQRIALFVTAFVLTGFISKNSLNSTNDESKIEDEATSSHADSFPETLQEMIQKALDAVEQAPDMRSWKLGGYAPESVFLYVQGMSHDSDNSAEIWKDFCELLLKLDPHSLSLFRDQISKYRSDLKCANKLKSKIIRHWTQKENEFNDYATQDLKEKYPYIQRLYLNSFGIHPLKTTENHEIPIDASKGVRLPQNEHLQEKQVVLTFDDGPHPIHSPKILATLKAYKVRANYFQVGEMAKQYKNITQQIADAGNVVGSHSYSHPDLAQMDICHAEKEIISGRDAIADALNTTDRPWEQIRVPFFRFPYGESNEQLDDFTQNWAGFNAQYNNPCRGHTLSRRILEKKDGLASFMWDIDSKDWKYRDPIVLYNKLIKALESKKGGIVLLHDIHEQTAIILPQLLNYLIAEGYSTYVYVPH